MSFAANKVRQGAAGVSTDTGEYDIPNSLRFNDDDTAYLEWTPSSASSDADRKKWTWSGWVKLGNLGVNRILWSANTTSNYIRIFSDNTIGFGISGVANYQSTAVFRDPSAWYHVVCKVDTTLSSNRIVIYVNNEAVLSVNGYSQDAITPFSNTVVHRIGRDTETPEANYLDGYLAEVNFIDGHAKLPTDFGEFDETYGHWKAKKYTHSDGYGTNGFYLDFTDNTSFSETWDNLDAWTSSGQGSCTTTSNELTVSSYGSGSSWHGPIIEHTFSNPYGDFDISLNDWSIANASSDLHVFKISLLDSSNNVVAGYSVNDSHADSSSSNHGYYINGGTSTAFAATPDLTVSGDWGITRAGNQITFTMNGYTNVTTTENNSNSVHSIKIEFDQYSTYAVPTQKLGQIQMSGAALKEAGDDASGNGNDWSPNNLSITDQMLDSPTNNFATLNPLSKDASATFKEGNTRYDTPSGFDSAISTIPMSTGKWYCEVVPASGSYPDLFGLFESSSVNHLTIYVGGSTDSYGYYGYDGTKYNNTSSSYGSSYTTGDVIGIAFDADNGALYFSKNGVWQNSGVPTSGSSATGAAYTGLNDEYVFAISEGSSGGGNDLRINFGQDSSFAGNKTAQGYKDDNNTGLGDFYYIPPAGYKALCTKNLPPIADGLWSGGDNQAFNTVLWSGDGNDNRSISVGFQPDLTWNKRRSTSGSHMLHDSIRGATKVLSSDLIAQEATESNAVKAFESDGFKIGTDNNINSSDGRTYVAWNWKAAGNANTFNVLSGGSVTSNDSYTGLVTAGTITTGWGVSANRDAGFSIVSYEGNGSDNQTIGHGLLQKPDVVIIKPRNYNDNWVIATEIIDGTRDAGYFTNASFGNETRVGMSEDFIQTDGWNNTNDNNDDYIAYCFHSVSGYSKIGIYTANHNADGSFIYTGFKPAYVMCKAAGDDSGYTSWTIHDSARNPSNEITTNALYADRNYEEGKRGNGSSHTTSPAIDFLSNGFKLRTSGSEVNSSNKDPYIYLAFAEHPFKYSTAR